MSLRLADAAGAVARHVAAARDSVDPVARLAGGEATQVLERRGARRVAVHRHGRAAGHAGPRDAARSDRARRAVLVVREGARGRLADRAHAHIGAARVAARPAVGRVGGDVHARVRLGAMCRGRCRAPAHAVAEARVRRGAGAGRRRARERVGARLVRADSAVARGPAGSAVERVGREVRARVRRAAIGVGLARATAAPALAAERRRADGAGAGGPAVIRVAAKAHAPEAAPQSVPRRSTLHLPSVHDSAGAASVVAAAAVGRVRRGVHAAGPARGGRRSAATHASATRHRLGADLGRSRHSCCRRSRYRRKLHRKKWSPSGHPHAPALHVSPAPQILPHLRRSCCRRC